MAGQKPKLRSNARGEVRAGAAGAGRRPAHQGRDGSVRFAQRLRQGACLLRAAGQRQRPAARGAGGARKPRPDPHIEDITRRLALDNFIAFAPDALFPLGAYPGDKDKARDLFGKLDQPKMQQDFVAAAAYLKGVRGGNGKVGAVGFCYSGGVVNMLVTRWPELGAAYRITALRRR